MLLLIYKHSRIHKWEGHNGDELINSNTSLEEGKWEIPFPLLSAHRLELMNSPTLWLSVDAFAELF